MITNMTGVQIAEDVSPDEAVALGASVQAAIIAGHSMGGAVAVLLEELGCPLALAERDEHERQRHCDRRPHEIGHEGQGRLHHARQPGVHRGHSLGQHPGDV